MPEPLLTDDDVRAMLREACPPRGGIRAFAAKIGVSPCYLSLMISGHRGISDRMAEKLGLRVVRGFERVQG